VVTQGIAEALFLAKKVVFFGKHPLFLDFALRRSMFWTDATMQGWPVPGCCP
jgi:hypothetical protein